MARGRTTGCGGPTRMTCKPFAAAVGLLLLAACGALETPVATVSGRILGAGAGAYAYPLGRPDLKVLPSIDGAGTASYRLEGVPTDVRALVLWDGADRAELVPVDVVGGETNRVADRYGAAAAVSESARMPLAGTVLAAALPEGGAVPAPPAFTLLETDHFRLPPDDGETVTATLYPVPAGRFEILATTAGFRERRISVQVIAGGTVPAQLLLEVDLDAEAPGCAATESCENDLHCDGGDGRCYACAGDADCDAEERCDAAVGLCTPRSGPATEICAGCDPLNGCSAPLVCVVLAGEATGYCSAPAPACPAGFADDGLGRCVAPAGCDHWLQTMGAACLDDEPCGEGLAGGRCERIDPSPGRCTAACVTDADCRIGSSTALFTCVDGPLGFHCVPPP
jgi:hypothetical protein